MESFEKLQEKAKKKLQIADHMLTMTYPFVQDPKLLMAVVDNLFLALSNSMSSVLQFERTFKKIPPYQDTFASKFHTFKSYCMQKYDVDKENLDFIQEIKEIIVEHQKSPVEFSKKDRFIICSDDYNMKAVTLDLLKNYVKKTKIFVKKLEKLKNESIAG